MFTKIYLLSDTGIVLTDLVHRLILTSSVVQSSFLLASWSVLPIQCASFYFSIWLSLLILQALKRSIKNSPVLHNLLWQLLLKLQFYFEKWHYDTESFQTASHRAISTLKWAMFTGGKMLSPIAEPCQAGFFLLLCTVTSNKASTG